MQSFAFSPQDFITDEIYSKGRWRRWLNKVWFCCRLIKILNVFDVVSDAYKTFLAQSPEREWSFSEIESDIPFEGNIEIDFEMSPTANKTQLSTDSDEEWKLTEMR